MTSDRMMQAIGRIERAISRLEPAVGRLRDTADAHARDRDAARALAREVADELEAMRAVPPAPPSPPEPQPTTAARDGADPFSHDKALAALRSLDSLIDDLQRARRDG